MDIYYWQNELFNYLFYDFYLYYYILIKYIYLLLYYIFNFFKAYAIIDYFEMIIIINMEHSLSK